MFERFTDRARRVVVLAQEEARLLDHGYIGTEHLLLGLIHEGGGVAATALKDLGINLDAVREEVKALIGRGEQPPSGHIPFTPRAKKVLELSLRESTALGHFYIGTEHILLGLVREGKGVAAQVLIKLGADLNAVRQQVIKVLHTHAGEGPPGTSAVRRAGMVEEVLAGLDKLEQRLTAIERWVGMGPDLHELDQQIEQLRHDKEAAINAQDFETASALRDKEKGLLAVKDSKGKEWTPGTGDHPSMAEDVLRLSTELDRLRTILRDHGIEPGDDPGQSSTLG